MNVVLIGCGAAARHLHLPALASIDRVNLLAVIEPNPPARMGLACPSFEKLSDFDGPADVALICAPPNYHEELVSQALRRGLHVYLEKPMAPTLQAAQRMLEEQRQSGLQAMIGFNQRFRPSFARAQEMVSELSCPKGGVGYMGSPEGSAWRGDLSAGGGALLDLACHHVDLVPWLLGSKIAEGSVQKGQSSPKKDSLSLWFCLESGFEFQGFYGYSCVEDDRLELYGKDHGLQWRRYLPWPRELGVPVSRLAGLKGFARVAQEALYQLKGPKETSYRNALLHFFSCIREKKSPQPDFERGVQVQSWLEAIQN